MNSNVDYSKHSIVADVGQILSLGPVASVGRSNSPINRPPQFQNPDCYYRAWTNRNARKRDFYIKERIAGAQDVERALYSSGEPRKFRYAPASSADAWIRKCFAACLKCLISVSLTDYIENVLCNHAPIKSRGTWHDSRFSRNEDSKAEENKSYQVLSLGIDISILTRRRSPGGSIRSSRFLEKKVSRRCFHLTKWI